MKSKLCISISVLVLLFGLSAQAQSDEDLAQKLANPIASLISIPIQADYDENYGPTEDWNLISRTILPIVNQNHVPANGTSDAGLGDTVQSLFFSPKEPTDNGMIWGVGPVFLLPK